MKPKSKKSTKLSSNLLKMKVYGLKIDVTEKLKLRFLFFKFMKKTAAQEQEEQALEEQKHLIDDEHWYLDTEQKKDTDSNMYA